MNETVTFRSELLTGVACAPKRMPVKEVVRHVNAEHPTGSSGGWQIARRRKLEDGTKLPAPCLNDPGRVHYLLECRCPDSTTDYAALAAKLRGAVQVVRARGDYGDLSGAETLDRAAAAPEALVRENAELRVRLDNLLRQLTETSGTS